MFMENTPKKKATPDMRKSAALTQPKTMKGVAMKRDADLIRLIALKVESLKPRKELSGIDGIDNECFIHNVQLMLDAGLVEAKVYPRNLFFSEPSATVTRLTWSGCDFLDAARSESLWNKAKQSVIAPTASWTFDILKDWLKAEIRSGLPSIRGIAN